MQKAEIQYFKGIVSVFKSNVLVTLLLTNLAFSCFLRHYQKIVKRLQSLYLQPFCLLLIFDVFLLKLYFKNETVFSKNSIGFSACSQCPEFEIVSICAFGKWRWISATSGCCM